jgi:predicted dehydrogenase
VSAAPVRVGLVGAGRIARLHLDALATVPRVEVAALADVRPEAAQALATRYGVPRVVGSVEELLREGVDVVHSCVANVSHAEVAAAVLAAGRHLVAEKPLAMELADARELVRLAEDGGLHAYVCFTRRHLPAIIRLRDETAAAGGAHLVRGGYLQDWLLRRTDWDWRLDRALSGRSATFADLGGHLLDTVEFVTGRRVTAIQATLGRLHAEREAGEPPVVRAVELEDHALFMARLEGGAQVSGTLSQVTAGWSDRLFLEVSLPERTLAWSYEHLDDVVVGRRSEGFVREGRAGRRPQGYTGFTAFVPDVYRAIRGETPHAPPATVRDGLHSMELVEAALESAETGRWVEVPAA